MKRKRADAIMSTPGSRRTGMDRHWAVDSEPTVTAIKFGKRERDCEGGDDDRKERNLN
ncbi:hypothetical protein HPP92_012331 [Vanilla planifolia]|uniref:Uncharacterized protein n=1 Tax=Vanilla planifolia TaxID=51239 RepID=A0A835R1C6_VANPL|nr:hypothetical protein HPP92_012323 [Vanilla planifolia]KAG0477612.1 hypothetical protein HPP92_012331 [Vanilla planifolia]